MGGRDPRRAKDCSTVKLPNYIFFNERVAPGVYVEVLSRLPIYDRKHYVCTFALYSDLWRRSHRSLESGNWRRSGLRERDGEEGWERAAKEIADGR